MQAKGASRGDSQNKDDKQLLFGGTELRPPLATAGSTVGGSTVDGGTVGDTVRDTVGSGTRATQRRCKAFPNRGLPLAECDSVQEHLSGSLEGFGDLCKRGGDQFGH